MNEHRLTGFDAADPLGFMAALGLLRVISKEHGTTLQWVREGRWTAVLRTEHAGDLADLLVKDIVHWRSGHPVLAFAEGADRKTQDLKQPPAEYREQMREMSRSADGAAFAAAFASGVAVDGGGRQMKPTSFHFTAGQQRFLDAVLSLRDETTRDDFTEALYGPWKGRTGVKDTRWKAGGERLGAMLSFDPGKEQVTTVAGAAWLAFQALPLFPCVPGPMMRAITCGFTGRGKSEQFTWPVWAAALRVDEVAILVGMSGLADLSQAERRARGVVAVYRSSVNRSAQGYGSFAVPRMI